MDAADLSATSRAEELNKLRCESASPSALSTASSGSPLMRSSSGSKGKNQSTTGTINQHGNARRPAPTSIAAAQLQFQQLEFDNKLASGAGSGAAGINPKAAAKYNQAARANTSRSSKQASLAHQMTYPMNGDYQQQQKSAKSLEAETGGKSYGYNLAKTLAFRAHRINEFWSINKLRYINLACLLMTLVCLATIIIFSTGSNQQLTQPSNGKKLSNQFLTDAEPIEALDSQPLVRSLRDRKDGNNNGNINLTTSFDDSTESAENSKSKRRPESAVAAETGTGATGKVADESSEREIEDAKEDSETLPGIFRHHSRLPIGVFGPDSPMAQPPPAFLAPILSSIFNDADIGSLVSKSLRNAKGNGKPTVIKKIGKNGATIIISSSSSFTNGSNSSSNEPIMFPSLLRELLPPMFRPINLSSLNSPGTNSSTGNSSQPELASATITIASESLPPFGAGLDSLWTRPPMPFGPFEPFGGRQSFLDTAASAGPSPFRISPMGRMGFGGPFGPGGPAFMMAASPPSMPPPGLLSMIMRANSMQDQEDELPPFMSQQSQASSAQNKTTGGSSAENLSAQASSQTSTATGNSTATTTTTEAPSRASSSKQDQEVETFDVSHLPRTNPMRMRNLYGMRPRISPLAQGGSMLIFSSGSFDNPRPFFHGHNHHHHHNPFMGPPPPPLMMPFGMSASSAAPPMMFMGEPGSGPHSDQASEIKPMIRAMLSEVMSDLAERKQSADQADRPAKISRVDKPAGGDWADLDDDWASDSSDDPAITSNASSLRARHRAAPSSDDSDSSSTTRNEFNQGEASEFVAGIHVGESQSSHNFDSQPPGLASSGADGGGLISGTIRQTIRGPNGVTSERVIEIPSRVIEQVGAGVKSQSLSRADFDESGAEQQAPRPFSISSDRIFNLANPFGGPRQALDQGDFPPIGIIGRLLSDLSRRVASGIEGSQTIKSRASDSEDSDPEAASSSQSHRASLKVMPPSGIRVASARVRVSPLAVIKSRSTFGANGSQLNHRASSSLFVTPTHFTLPGDHPVESGDESKLASSLEDTLNSVEDRLNNVFVSESAPTNQQVPPVESHSSDERKSAPLQDYMSPSSPLFGFPSSQMERFKQPQSDNVAPINSAGNDNKSAIAGAPVSTNSDAGSSRKPRKFTYHSNNEVAGSKQRESQAPNTPATLGGLPMIGRANRMVEPINLLPPPADLVMGRRADDSPNGESSSIFAPENNQQQQHRRMIRGIENGDEANYRTIVV